MKRKVFIFAGSFIFLLGILSNLQWAANDYGYHTISLNAQILAQDSGSGLNDGNQQGGGDSGGNTGNTLFIVHTYPCKMIIEGNVSVSITLFPGATIQPTADGKVTVSYEDVRTECEKGGNFLCKPFSCAEYWKSLK